MRRLPGWFALVVYVTFSAIIAGYLGHQLGETNNVADEARLREDANHQTLVGICSDLTFVASTLEAANHARTKLPPEKPTRRSIAFAAIWVAEYRAFHDHEFVSCSHLQTAKTVHAGALPVRRELPPAPPILAHPSPGKK